MSVQQSVLIPEQRNANPRRGARSARAGDGIRPRAAAFTVWYLRLLAVLNIVAVISLPFREEVHEHNGGEFFTPYLATAGLISAALALFLALVMRRRKRAAWIFNLLFAGPLLALYTAALTQERYRQHVFNWISALLTALFVLALLLGRKEFQAVGDRSNPRLALAVGAGGLLVSATLGTLLVSATNRVTGTPLSDRIAYTLLRGISVGPLADRFDSVVAPAGSTYSSTPWWPPRSCWCSTRASVRRAVSNSSARRTRPGCEPCWPGTGNATRSATSHCAVTRPSSGPRAARRPSRTASAAA